MIKENTQMTETLSGEHLLDIDFEFSSSANTEEEGARELYCSQPVGGSKMSCLFLLMH